MEQKLGFRHEDLDPELEVIARTILDSAKAVRLELGAGLFEEVYRLALIYELRSRGLNVATKVPLLLTYKGHPLGKAYEADIVVEGKVTLELKAQEALLPVHEAQILTYMRILGTPIGFLINFNSVPLGEGIRRKVLTSIASSRHRGETTNVR